MKILLICPYFPPENTIAAVRIAKFAEYWSEAGHEVTVLTRHAPGSGGLTVASQARVVRRRDPLSRAHTLVTGGQYDAPAHRGARSGRLRAGLGRVVRSMSPWPDRFAVWAALARLRPPDDRPDVVVASGGPLSSLMLGSSLARSWSVPWVADYRDLLSSGDYLRRGRFRRAVEQRLERRAVRTAAALTAVSQPMTDSLSAWLGVPGTTVMNGHDARDYPPSDAEPDDPQGRLRLVYCGEIYAGKRDPVTLFRALAALGPHQRSRIVVEFYGNSVDRVLEAAREIEVLDCVQVAPRVAYERSLALQRSADVLLSLMWDDPHEKSAYSGKLFEYIGARRPILSIGCSDGVAAELIRARGLGVATSDVREVTDQLAEWIEAKVVGEPLAWTARDDVEDLSRRAQSARALGVVEQVVERVAGER